MDTLKKIKITQLFNLYDKVFKSVMFWIIEYVEEKRRRYHKKVVVNNKQQEYRKKPNFYK